MTTRLYLTSTARSFPGASFDPDWENIGSGNSKALTLTKSGARTAIANSETSTSPTFDVAFGRWVSDPLTRSGTFDPTGLSVGLARVENSAAADFFFKYIIRVLTPTGAVRGNILNAVGGTEFPTTPTAIVGALLAPTPVVVQAGDRLVFELGFRATNVTATNQSASLYCGGTGPDLINADPAPTFGAAWLQLPDACDSFLTGTPVLDTNMVTVEIAWGADLTDMTGASWVWGDVTTDVRMQDAIATSLGRADEASTSQPADLALKLDNSSGDYSLGGQSANWPYVRRNVPVRVRVDGGAGYQIVFQGYANGFTPGWDTIGGQIPIVTLSASGILRRLAQGKDPLRSALYRYNTLTASPREYWPLEEDKTALNGISATGGAPATLEVLSSGGVNYGKIEWGGDTDNPATERAVQVSAGGGLLCAIDTTAYTGSYWAVSWSMKYSSKSGAFTKFATDDFATNIRYHATWFNDGSMDMTLITDQSVAFTILSTPAYDNYLWDNVWHNYIMTVDYTSTATVHRLYRDGVLLSTNSATPGYRQRPRLLRFQSAANPSGTEDPVAIAHVATWTSAVNTAAITLAAQAYLGEQADDRLTRLCTEQAIPLAITGSADETMGPQLPLSFVDLLRECEAVNQGILYDGVGPGLAFISRGTRENQSTDLTLAGSQLVAPFTPRDDDQRTRNRMTASSTLGSKFTFEDATGPMGTDIVGVYDGSLDVNVQNGSEAANYAAWAVHLGTVEGYRYPVVSLNMRNLPSLADDVVVTTPSSRITITSPEAVLASMPDEDIDVLVEGVSMVIAPNDWMVTYKCSPYGPWVIGTLASDTGDTDADLIRLDSTASVLTAFGATYFQVDKTVEAWTEVSDDFPLIINVGGRRFTCTGITTVGSDQRLTVTETIPSGSIPIGTRITVWNPPVLGLGA